MSWVDRLLGKPKVASGEDPVGPIGGSMAPVDPLVTAPYISPGNPGGTYAPLPNQIPSIESQQTPLMTQSVVGNAAYGNQLQRDYWPTEVHSDPLSTAPGFKDRGPDPRWNPTQFNEFGPVNGHIVYSFNRPWHLAARLDGNRTYLDASDIPVPSSEGFVGLRKAPRASMFTEPAPWGTNVIDTTQASGTPTSPGNAATPTSVVYSPSQFAGSNNRSYRLM
jgi:hypothetical protein